MAYVPGQKLDEEQQGAPGAPSAPSISGPSVGSTPGGAAGTSEVSQSNASGGGGTGFVNIDKYLNANKGASQDVTQRADKALSEDAGAFGAEAGKVQANVDAQKKPIVDPNQMVDSVLGAKQEEQKQAAIKTAQDAINASFQGQGTVNYDIGNTENVKRAQALGNAKSAGKQIAQDTGTLSKYGTGLSAIDAAIYGSQQEQPNLQKVQEKTKGQVESQIADKGRIEADAGATAEAIKKQGADIRSAFQNRAQKLQDEAQKKADAAFAQQTSDQLNGVLRDPTTGQVVSIPERQQLGGWEAGSGNPTAANFLDANGLSSIGSVLGDKQMAATQAGPAFTSGRYTTIPGEKAYDVGQLQVNEIKQQPENAKSVRAATKDLTPEQLADYQQIRRDFPSLTAAQAAEDARTGTTANRDQFGHGANTGQAQVKGVY